MFMAQNLIDVEALTEEMLSDRPPVILDVRWALGRTDGRDRYREGHIPGAVYVDLDSELADPPSAELGRHPLPSSDRLQDAARRWGVDDSSPVVVYDDIGNLAAARAWWLLTWAGHLDVRMLDGGLDAWRSAGMRVSAGNTAARPGTVTLTCGDLPHVSLDEVARLSSEIRDGRDDVVILDARAGERYRGETEPMDPRAGHVPGAVSVPTAGNLADDGRFLSPEQLRERFTEAGVTENAQVIAYCGSGINAAHELAALAIAGFSGALFPGSWSQWCADPELPAAVGPTP
ncbi:sulfurtransferase [Gordonia sp. N1V]|uniref:sulfurtransferase n=1 Tax=Gordonia sp. N1V TaxID=3034163 RepID=UPI0023E284A2|nr:sulfurtransferase [Gordonia sp. N1V]MDF3283857.1 sulfurtransferase [Gordonia sp. N1V]